MINQTLLRIILILTSALIESSLPRISQAQSLAELGDGTYQLCSQPAPETWQQGAGVCLVGVKQHDSFSGYDRSRHSLSLSRQAVDAWRDQAWAKLVSLQGRGSDLLESGHDLAGDDLDAGFTHLGSRSFSRWGGSDAVENAGAVSGNAGCR